ncbi:MAG: InlB B-repeat-containing protein, partial [Clostridia bacterium]|nr:InlB B-repeat-containing protein [Clostridia bacterium]
INYLNYYGNLVVDELYETHNPKNEQPTEENGYNFFGSAAPAQWYNEEGHLVHAPTVSTDFIKEKLGDRNYYGTFTVGANNHEVTFKFFMDGVCKETVVLPSGVNPPRPAFEKVGYTLTAWTLTEDFEYQADSSFIVGNETGSVDFHAVFTPNTYMISFDFGEAKEEVEQTYNEKLIPPTPQERNGYRFIGWFTQEDGKGDKLVVGSNYDTASDITFYAYYEKEFPVFYVVISIVGTVLIISVAVLAGFAIYRRKHPHMVPATDSGTPIPEEKVLPDTSMLSQREKEVLELLLQGKQRNEIATILYISENTVKKNISSIYTKLNVSSRNELFALFK